MRRLSASRIPESLPETLPGTVLRTLPETLMVSLLIFFSIILLYGPGLNYPFFFDDYNSLMNDQGLTNPLLQDAGARRDELFQRPFKPDRNLTWLTFALDYQKQPEKLEPGGFRRLNLLLFGGCALLLYLILWQLGADFQPEAPPAESGSLSKLSGLAGFRRLPQLLGLVFFLVHPLALNSVLYVSQRFTLLAAFFYLLSFYAWLKAREAASTGGRITGYLLSGLAFWAALHSKEMTITLPLTILFFEAFRSRSSLRQGWLFPAAALLIAAAFVFFAFKIGLFNQSWINIGFRSQRLWSPGIHLLSEARAFWGYWLRLLLPLPGWLSLHHEFPPSPSLSDPVGLVAAAAHLLVLSAAWKLRRRTALAAFGVCWFYLVLGPPYLFLPQKELLVEYKTLLAAPGVAMLLAGALQGLVGKDPGLESAEGDGFNLRAKIGLALILVWLSGLTVITFLRRPAFAGPLTIWSDVLDKYPQSRRARNNRAVAQLKNGDPAGALADFDHLVHSHPDYARGFENRGRLRFYLKDYSGAAADFTAALQLLPIDKPELRPARRELARLRAEAQQAASKKTKGND